MRILVFMAAALAAILVCSPARADEGCAAISEIVREVEEPGFTGAYSEGAYIYPTRVPATCRVAMADALAAYRTRIAADLAAPAHTRYRHWLYWEEARWAGNAHLYDRAAALTRQAMAEQHNQPDAYFAAIVAFFLRDRAAYDAAHQQLLRDVQARYYSRNTEIAFSVGDALIAGSEGLGVCWDRPFAEAYSITCYGDVMDRLLQARQR